MTQEEKARAYDEALERAKSFQEKYGGDYAGYIFPDLRESEDERIRKNIVSIINQYSRICAKEGDSCDDINECLAWLEKQKEQKPERINVKEMVAKYGATDEYIEGEYKGKPINCMIRAYEQGIRDTLLKVKEQKPTASREGILHQLFQNGSITLSDYLYLTGEKKQEWSEEDKQCLDEAIEILENLGYDGDADNLKRLRPQPKQEWSEEDDDMLNSCISSIEEAKENRYAYKETDGDTSYDHEIAWLKSLRPSWKPSEEQMKMLAMFTNLRCASRREANTLESLYNDLKKLM